MAESEQVKAAKQLLLDEGFAPGVDQTVDHPKRTEIKAALSVLSLAGVKTAPIAAAVVASRGG